MLILTINCKMNSLKYSLFDMKNEKLISNGIFEGIGSESGRYELNYSDQSITEELVLDDHNYVAELLIDKLLSLSIIDDKDDIKAVGHRVLNGGEKYLDNVIINKDVINDIINDGSFVKFYQKANVLGIEAFRNVLSQSLMVAVFDTGFYKTLSNEKFLYSVPYNWYHKYGVRKYGAHGIIHKNILEKISQELNKDNFKLISCHIGNGVSISAIDNMKCIDTSMGFTPLSGLIMSTRSGDIDPSIIPYVMEKEGKNALEIIDDLNKKSGLLGISELTGDFNELLDECSSGNQKAILAKNMYINSIVDYIAKYYVLLNGCDVLSFTGGIGENNDLIRKEICDKLSCLGVIIDEDKNKDSKNMIISSRDSKVIIYVVHKDEELFIARETLKTIK